MAALAKLLRGQKVVAPQYVGGPTSPAPTGVAPQRAGVAQVATRPTNGDAGGGWNVGEVMSENIESFFQEKDDFEIEPNLYQFVESAMVAGKFSVANRNLYYAARNAFLKKTGRPITSEHFKSLLTKYVNQHPEETATWKLTADPRGTLEITNTAHDRNHDRAHG